MGKRILIRNNGKNLEVLTKLRFVFYLCLIAMMSFTTITGLNAQKSEFPVFDDQKIPCPQGLPQFKKEDFKVNLNKINHLEKSGIFTVTDTSAEHITYVTYARGRDVAWENDRIAFRVFGPEVREKVGSGIDVWAKSVNYPILDKWYRLSAEGKDYHKDRGEGCDFYDMGKLRGCGGLALWIEAKPYPSETYDSFKIIENKKDKIAFELNYETWNTPGPDISEHRRIEMEPGTNLFRVTSTLMTDEERDFTIAIGLTTYGNPKVHKDSKRGILSVWEQIDPAHGHLGTAILIDPEKFIGFRNYGDDEIILVKVKANEPFIYYSGAGWDKNKYFKSQSDWEKYLRTETKRVKF